MTKPYCGIKTVIPKGYHSGNMKECGLNRQIRKWGVLKADQATINAPEMRNQNKQRRMVLIKKLTLLRSQITKMRDILNLTGSQSQTSRAKEQKNEAKDKLPGLEVQYKKYSKEFQKLPKI